MERVFIIPQYLLYYVEKIMLYHFSKSIKSFKSFFNYMYWILKLYTNIHCEKFNVPLSFNNDISWKFLKIMTFFMCFTLLIKSKFTIDNLIRGMDRGGSLKTIRCKEIIFWIFQIACQFGTASFSCSFASFWATLTTWLALTIFSNPTVALRIPPFFMIFCHNYNHLYPIMIGKIRTFQ